MAQAYAVKFPAGKGVIDIVIAQIATFDARGALTAFGPMKDMTYEVIEKNSGTTLVTSKNTNPPLFLSTKTTNTSLTPCIP